MLVQNVLKTSFKPTKVSQFRIIFIAVFGGNLLRPKPLADKTGSDWDGAGVNAIVLKPEHLYQTSGGDIVYFVDGRSCARYYSRIFNNVTTFMGKYMLLYYNCNATNERLQNKHQKKETDLEHKLS